jgi:hypothetical protein
MQAQDFLKVGLMLSLGIGAGPWALINYAGVMGLDLVLRTYGTWSTWWCRRPRPQQTHQGREIRAAVTCERTVPATNARQQNPSMFLTRLDAVIHYVANNPALRNLLSVTHHDYIPYDYEPIPLDNDIYFQLSDLKVDEGQLTTMKFKLFCYDHDIRHIQRFMDSCNTDYERKMKSQLGSNLFFFDQMVQGKQTKRSTQNPLPQTHLVYTKHPYSTTRTFKNVYFDEQPIVSKRTEFFLEHKDWYEKKGIPYTLGFLFHGEPGCGKTSETKAIAHSSRRHIINIQLAEIKTKSQLRHLFFNEEIHVFNGQNAEKYIIPIHERLYVIEDIDAMGDTILERAYRHPRPEDARPKDPFGEETEEVFKEPIDLAFLLNLLDGTLEASGRMMIITSNYPERIDRALIRPGRIDMIVHFRKCSRHILKQMVIGFYDVDIPDDHEIWSTPEMDFKWSPAEVNQILFRNFDTPNRALDELLTLTPQSLYGFRSGADSEDLGQSATA